MCALTAQVVMAKGYLGTSGRHGKGVKGTMTSPANIFKIIILRVFMLQ